MVQFALDPEVPVSGIAEAVFARSLSGHADLREAARGRPGPSPAPLGKEAAAAFADRVEQALYASKIVSYTQGFHQIRAGSQAYDWNIDLGAVAAIRRPGCIIRAAFLDRVPAACDARPDLLSLLSDRQFAEEIGAAQDDWRAVVAEAVRQGVPTPGFAAALSYYDGPRADRLPAALTQGQRTSSARTPTAVRTARVLSTPPGAVTGRSSSRADARTAGRATGLPALARPGAPGCTPLAAVGK